MNPSTSNNNNKETADNLAKTTLRKERGFSFEFYAQADKERNNTSNKSSSNSVASLAPGAVGN